MSKERLLSHQAEPKALDNATETAQNRILNDSSLNDEDRHEALLMLQQLGDFELGRFLLINKGLNGYWTDYILTYPKHRQSGTIQVDSPLESFLLEQAPTLLATQERYQIFLQENQQLVKDNATLASIPCGVMGELFPLNLDGRHNVTLVGIDYDSASLEIAKERAKAYDLKANTLFEKHDAWNLPMENTFDLISSNGLNIYEPDDEKVVALYKQFYKALKPGGTLVTSFLTPPPNSKNPGIWQLDTINPAHLHKQKLLFSTVLNTGWQCFRSCETTIEQLESAGFDDINLLFDQANLFPTVSAKKST